MKDSNVLAVEKVLSKNDLGATGSHQAGVAIPKAPEMLGFFPDLDETILNPRVGLEFIELRRGQLWKTNYIYYNGKTLGLSSRDEYRLTGLGRFFAQRSAQPGDVVRLERSPEGLYMVELVRQSGPIQELTPHTTLEVPGKPVRYETIKLSGTWSVQRRRRG